MSSLIDFKRKLAETDKQIRQINKAALDTFQKREN